MKSALPKLLIRKYLVRLVAAVLLYAVVGFVAAPLVLRWYLPRYLQQNLPCQAGVDRMYVNPFLLTLEVDGFFLNQADGAPLVAIERFFVDLEMSSLLHWAVVLQKLEVDKPALHVALAADGSFNFAKLVQAAPQTANAPVAAPELFPVILRSATIRAGRIAVADQRHATPAEVSLQEIHLDLIDVSTRKDQNGTCRLAAATAAGESIRWEGAVALSPFRSKGTLSLNALRVASLWQFFRETTNLEQPTGQIDLTTEYRLDAEHAPVQLTLEGLRFSAADLALKLSSAEKVFFHLKKMVLEVPRFDLSTRDLHVARLFFEEGGVDARINDSGEMNFQQILRAAPPEKHPDKEKPSPVASPVPSSPAPEYQGTVPPAIVPSFRVQADAIEVTNMAMDLDDQSRKAPVKAAIAGMDLHLQANLAMGADTGQMVLREIAGELRGIKVHGPQPQEPLFAAEQLTVAGGFCDLGAHAITFGRIGVNKGRLDAGRDAAGALNWQQLFLAKGAAGQSPKNKPAAGGGPAWKFLVKSFEVVGFEANFSDLTTPSAKPLLSLREVKARLTEVDGRSPMGFAVGFQVEQGGSATMSGTLHPAIPAVEAELDVSGVVLTALQPYLDPYLTLQLQSAAIAAQGRLRYGIPGDAQQGGYEGNFSLNTLRFVEAESPRKTYLGWDAVHVPKLKLTLQPNRLEAQEIKISKPVGEFIIGEDNTLNLLKVLKKRAPEKKSSLPPKAAMNKGGQQKETDSFPYHIGKVRVEKGNVVFADLSLRPRFMTSIHDLQGTVTGVSSARDAQSQVQLDGQVDRYGTVKIRGAMRPNDFGRASDIEMVFRNLEMKNLSPYSGKFAGRLIQSGKVSADLKYTLHDYKMVGDNKIVIDNLALGDQVDHPGSTNLPLDLAIALLQDSSGRIDIGLPVSGDLNDPQFRIGPLVWQMFTNLITTAVTSPFRALGSLLGGESDQFKALEFDPGKAELSPPVREKLLQLAEALNSRPQLKLVLQGRYSPAIDGLEFKARSVGSMVAARLGEKLGPHELPGPIDFTDSGTRSALEKLYKERFGKESLLELEQGIAAGTVTPRPPVPQRQKKGEDAGMVAKMLDGMQLYKLIPGGKSPEQGRLWSAELYARLVDSEPIADQSLLQLAEQRAQSIAANLESDAKIPKDRVGIKAPEPFSGNEPPAVTLSLDVL